MTSLPENWRTQLTELRTTLYHLHKALVESERSRYEAEHGPIGSSGKYLQLLINDRQFTWLQPYTRLVVSLDETLESKEAILPAQVAQHWQETRSLTLGQIHDASTRYAQAHASSLRVQDQHAILMAVLSEAPPAQSQ
ncbi:MAG TPA: hypothetical protein PKD72_09395 [Gemmatales bacterium]|nr:hypothetical protein [Gemmatales bacterium]